MPDEDEAGARVVGGLVFLPALAALFCGLCVGAAAGESGVGVPEASKAPCTAAYALPTELLFGLSPPF